MEITLKTISPVHIGNGEKLYALDYIIHNNFYYRVTQNQFLKFLGSDEKLSGEYAKWIVDIQNRIDELETAKKKVGKNEDISQRNDYNQKLNTERQNFNLLKFAQKHNLQNQFLIFLQKHCNVKTATSITPKGNQIAGALKTGTEQLYLPGTSIKGSVRTALLFNVLCSTNETIENIIKTQFHKLKNNSKLKDNERTQQLDDSLDQFCFYCETEIEKQGRKEIKKDDEKFDLMKLVIFSDGILDSQKDALGLGKVDLYIVQKDVRSGNFEASKQLQTPIVEYIQENQDIRSQFNFNIDFLFVLKDKIQTADNTSFITIAGKKQWIGISEKIKTLFGLDINSLTKENLESKREGVLHYILNCVHSFSKAQKEADEAWFENFKKHDLANKYHQRIKPNYDIISNQEKLIRLGYATGFSGMTELLYIKQSSQSLQDLFKEIMECFKIGNSQQNKGKYTARIDKFPKSRRMITESESIKPMGWLLLVESGDELLNKNIANSTQSKSPIEQSLEAKPDYYKGKIKQDAKGIEAKVIKSGKPNKVKLFIAEGNEPDMDLFGYSSELPEGSIILVKINQYNQKKNIITQIGFEKFKK
jgi:CRISPR-associated protein Csm5